MTTTETIRDLHDEVNPADYELVGLRYPAISG